MLNLYYNNVTKEKMEDFVMEKLKILKSSKNTDTITRTIRMSGTTFDKVMELAEKNGVSFNNVVNQIIEYGLANIADEEKKK